MKSRSAPSPRALEDWDDVRVFLAIHRAGSLSAASTMLGITQPTCGRRLSALEEALGTQLFLRTPSGLRVTAEGSALIAAASQMEDAARGLALRAATAIEKLDGVVHVAMTEFTALAFGTRVLPVLRERYAGIRVEFVIADAFSDILDREVDLAVRWRGEGFRPSPAKVVARKLGRIDWCLFGSESYLARRGTPRDPSNLGGHEVVLYAGGGHPGHEWLAKATHDSVVALASSNIICNAAAVSEGVGLGFFPKPIVRLQPLLRPLTPAIASGWAWLVMHPDLRRVPRIRAVADVLADAMRSDLRDF